MLAHQFKENVQGKMFALLDFSRHNRIQRDKIAYCTKMSEIGFL